MLVRALFSFPPSVGGVVEVGDVFELPNGVDWLKCGIVEKAEAGAEVTRSIEPQSAGDPPHQALRENVKESMVARAGGTVPTRDKVTAAAAGVLEKKRDTALKQARKKAKTMA